MAKLTVETPMEKGMSSHRDGGGSHKGGPGIYNGEPGLPERTKSSNAVPEKVYEGEGGLKRGQQR